MTVGRNGGKHGGKQGRGAADDDPRRERETPAAAPTAETDSDAPTVPPSPQEGHRSHMEPVGRIEARRRLWVGAVIILLAVLFVLFVAV